MTKGGAIAAHCRWCRDAKGSRRERLQATEACPHRQCALWPFRPVVRPDKAAPVVPRPTP
jgi:hypothetical protein